MTHHAWSRAALVPTALRLWAIYCLLAVLKRWVPLPTLARWAWVDGRRPRDRRSEQRVAGVIGGLRRRLHVSDDCLQASLLLYRELSRLGADPMLAVGFRRAGERLEGHAWVAVDGRPLQDAGDPDSFVSVFYFGAHGALVDSQPV
jgi:hypothetical protein